MKKLILALLLAAPTCQPGYSHQIDSLDYPSPFLMEWIHNCSEELKMQYYMKGYPPPIAERSAIYNCACVIDQLRSKYSQNILMGMSQEERRDASEEATLKCLGSGKVS
mgnify:CR=1 FL=1|tara:strand:- start:1209 stop:1535 length:327 start_codon:yes stop_codon:yes gene_type:complete